MKRRLFTILSVLSLLVFAASVTLWVRSYFLGEELLWINETFNQAPQRVRERTYGVSWDWGAIYVMHAGSDVSSKGIDCFVSGLAHTRFTPSADHFHWQPAYSSNDRLDIALAGFRLRYGTYQKSQDWSSWQNMVIPLWCFLPTAIPPIMWLRRRSIRKQRLRNGLCPTCGHDLRATPERCPECGTLAESKRVP